MISILQGDCRSVLRSLPDESVHCVVTSPPYFGLRDYGTATWEGGDPECDHTAGRGGNLVKSAASTRGGANKVAEAQAIPYRSECGRCGARRIDSQIGLEPTPEAYVAELVAVFREVRRVLRKDGTCWLNLGDSYAGGGNGNGGSFAADRANWRVVPTRSGQRAAVHGLKPKDLIGIPWSVAFALRADGWWLRQDIIWAKPNPMPESVTDRCTKAHEYIFLLTKSAVYYYDEAAIAEEIKPEWVEHYRKYADLPTINAKANADRNDGGTPDTQCGFSKPGITTRNKRSVWTVATAPFPGSHFAVFPPALVEPCIIAGCPAKCCAKCGAPWMREVETSGEWRAQHDREQKHDGSVYRLNPGGGVKGPNTTTTRIDKGFSPSCSCDAGTVAGTCLDPFGGAGTTGLVADRLQRNAILIELNSEYAAMAERRIFDDAPLLMEAAE
jgi:DNA modification methylase